MHLILRLPTAFFLKQLCVLCQSMRKFKLAFNQDKTRVSCHLKSATSKGHESHCLVLCLSHTLDRTRKSSPATVVHLKQLLMKMEETTIHCRHLHKLVVEKYECKKSISPSILSELFTTKEIKYYLRITNLLQVPKVKTLLCGKISLLCRSSIFWNTLLESIKSTKNRKKLGSRITAWRRGKCECSICR